MGTVSFEDCCINPDKNLLLCINISFKELPTAQLRLCSLFDHQQRFDNSYQCEEYISQHVSNDDRIVLIIDETSICESFLRRIERLRQVSAVYIQCSTENTPQQFNKV